jgi:putative redox protein
MELTVDFPGASRVDVHLDKFIIKTDQPVQQGGEESAPTPFSTFLASIGACAGIYILGFCHQRGIATDGMKILQRTDVDPTTGMTSRISLDIVLPSNFPEKYKQAIIRAADQCAVKKHLLHPPSFEIKTLSAESVAA